MYLVQYWNPADAEWRGTGTRNEDRDTCIQMMKAVSEQCGHCCDFRVIKEAD